MKLYPDFYNARDDACFPRSEFLRGPDNTVVVILKIKLKSPYIIIYSPNAATFRPNES